MSSAKDRGELTITLRMKGRPVVLVGEGAVAEEQRGLLKRAGAFIVAEGSKAAFAIVVDDPAAVSRLKVRGCLVYAVGQPDLSDFTLASPAPAPTKAARKAESAAVKAPAPEVYVEPAPARDTAPAPAPPQPPLKVREPRAAKPPKPPKAPKPPRPERPPVEIKLPPVSLAPMADAAKATGRVARGLWARTMALGSPMLRISTPFTRTVASNIQHRIDRARERPISLDLALVKGGLLDHDPEAAKPEPAEPQASESPDVATAPPTGASDAVKS